jgi:hypothetical protein
MVLKSTLEKSLYYGELWQPAQENTVLSPKPIHFGHKATVKYHPVVGCRVKAR